MQKPPTYDHALHRITVNREREFHIDFHCGEWPEPDLDNASQGILCNAGVIAVEMAPPRKEFGELAIPESAQKRLRAHFGVVVSSGCDWLKPGDYVCTRAYRGLHFEPLCCDVPPATITNSAIEKVRLQHEYVTIKPEERPSLPMGLHRAIEPLTHIGTVVQAGARAACEAGDRIVFSRYHHRLRAGGLDTESYTRLDTVGDLLVQHSSMIYATLKYSGYRGEYVRFFGGVNPLNESILMVGQRQGGELTWRPSPGWVWIERALNECAPSGILLSERASRTYRVEGRIVRMSCESPHEGERCIVNPEPNAGIWFGLCSGETPQQLIRERDVWAIVT